jgi:ABC-type uncharacterized transport system permease subunit
LYVAFVAALVKIRLTRKVADDLNADAPNGWDRWKSVFFPGTFTVIDGIYMTFYFFGVRKIPDAIRTGQFDLCMAKPVSPLEVSRGDGPSRGTRAPARRG